MIDPARLDHAIAAHAKWKFRLREAIQAGQSEWTMDAVRPDDRCEFGRGLISLSLPDRMSKEWREAKELHARFHGAAAEVLG
jgi:Chemoreceptor zinc-binding domain